MRDKYWFFNSHGTLLELKVRVRLARKIGAGAPLCHGYQQLQNDCKYSQFQENERIWSEEICLDRQVPGHNQAGKPLSVLEPRHPEAGRLEVCRVFGYCLGRAFWVAAIKPRRRCGEWLFTTSCGEHGELLGDNESAAFNSRITYGRFRAACAEQRLAR
jgi:hypothetical protein